MPRDSLIEQIISFSPIPGVVAVVSGLECPVRGLELVVICLCEL